MVFLSFLLHCFLFCPNPVPPQIMPFDFGDEPTNYGESTAVQCMITKGDLPLTINWSLNNQLIYNTNNGITINKMSSRLSSLSIESINDRHRGIFKCIASNSAGVDELSAELKVNGNFFGCKGFCFFILLISSYIFLNH